MFRKRFGLKSKSSDGHAERVGSSLGQHDKLTLQPSGDGLPEKSHPRGNNGSYLGDLAPHSALPYHLSRVQTNPSSITTAQPGLRDPIGLHVLYDPEAGRKVDIVFVHGLGGTSQMSWSKNKDIELFWPLKFLPLEPDIRHGRIMTFGYNATILKGSARTSASVLDFAKDLLFELKYAKDEKMEELNIGAVPMLFIVHSMGGLIVKEAYMQGQYDPDYQYIIKAVSAILFLSTPHRGTNLAEMLNRILQASFMSAPKQYISDLTKNSLNLQKLNEQFRHVAPKLDIVSFYETQTTAVGFNKNQIMVLEKDSSVLGYPGEISKALDADHHSVCKYYGQDDPNYVTVRNVLKSLVSKVLSSRGLKFISSTEQDESREVGTILAVPELPDVDYIFFRDRWAQGTCGWILEDSAYLSWLRSPSGEPRMLWLHGGPASGKSVLSSFIINNLAQEGACCQYFFVRFGDRSKRSLSMLLRSIAYQIAEVNPGFRERIRNLSNGTTNFKSADARTIWQRIFKSILFKMELVRPLYWVIDGVEESDNPKSMVKLMSEILSTAVPVRILIVSRKTQELLVSLQKLPKEAKFQSLSTEGRVEDFRQFISQELDVSGGSDFKESVTKRLLESARGNFLWINLAVQRVNHCHTEEGVDQALEELPPGMEALYDRMAQSIADNPREGDRKLASKILAWATCALRILTVGELSRALEKDFSQILDFQRSIADLCGGFVVADSGGNVAMIHQTAREYLLDPKRAFSLDRKVAHERLFMRCLSCLLEPGLRTKINRGQVPEFLDYAATSWFSHLCSSSLNSEVLDTVIKFLKGPCILTWIHILAETDQLRVLVSASVHLHTFALKRLELDLETMPLDRQISEREIVESWAVDLVKVVGKFGSNLIKSPGSIYKSIPPFCPQDSIMYRQFGHKESKNLIVSGLSITGWDDLLGRLSFGAETYASRILTAGSKILVMTPAGNIIVYHSSTFEQVREVQHGERLRLMVANATGTLLATYGYASTKVWDLSSGKCITRSNNPPGRPKPLALLFTDEDDTILLGADDGRIWSISISASPASWHVIAELDEQEVGGSIINSPNCMALSPDGSQVALGYRGHPLSVWEVDGPEPINHYVRNTHHLSTSEDAWGEVIQLTWHPYTSEVIGLYSEGIIFKWHPYGDESKEIRAGASRIVVSADGNFLATGDARGNIKLFSTQEFTLMYKLMSQDLVLDIVFSPDSRRFYDIRGTYGNIWEPNALIRLSELSEKGSGSDTASDVGSFGHCSSVAESLSSKIDPVTVLAAQPHGVLYCIGREDGTTELFEARRGKIMELGMSEAFMTTEQIAWSEDGVFVAFADLGGRVFVKRIMHSTNSTGTWIVESILEIRGNTSQGPILQLLFSPDSSTLLLYTSSTLSNISLVSKTVTLSRTFGSTSAASLQSKWLNHPLDTKLLIEIGHETINIWSWIELSPVQSFSFKSPFPNKEKDFTNPFSQAESLIPDNTSPSPFPPQDQTIAESVKEAISSDSPSLINNYFAQTEPSPRNPQNICDIVERVLPTADKTFLLVQFAHTSTTHHHIQNQRSVLLFETSSLSITSDINEVEPFILPENIASHIEIPLAFLSRDRLVFLDKDYWLCSWKLPYSPSLTSHTPRLSHLHRRAEISASSVAHRRVSSSTRRGPLDGVAGIAELKQHFFLPGDWISPDCVSLCEVMADGTVLCPRNGEVAVVKCASLGV